MPRFVPNPARRTEILVLGKATKQTLLDRATRTDSSSADHHLAPLCIVSFPHRRRPAAAVRVDNCGCKDDSIESGGPRPSPRRVASCRSAERRTATAARGSAGRRRAVREAGVPRFRRNSSGSPEPNFQSPIKFSLNLLKLGQSR
jgi:hypothetical protein